MIKCKSLIIPVIIMIITALILSSCGRGGDSQNVGNESVTSGPTVTNGAEEPATTPILLDPTAAPIMEEPVATPEVQPQENAIDENIDNNIDAFANLSYDIAKVLYEDGNIKIKYPRITGLKDTVIEDKINELIKNDAMKDVAEYGSEGAALDVKFEDIFAF